MSLLRVSRSLSSQLSRSAPGARSITRLSTSDPRMSGAVVHGDMVYLSGQVPAGGPAEWAKAPTCAALWAISLYSICALLLEGFCTFRLHLHLQALGL